MNWGLRIQQRNETRFGAERPAPPSFHSTSATARPNRDRFRLGCVVVPFEPTDSFEPA